MKLIKKQKILALVSGIIGAVGIISVSTLTPLSIVHRTQTQNSIKNVFSMNNVSTKWEVKTSSQKQIEADFNSLLNYDKDNRENKFSTLLSLIDKNNKQNNLILDTISKQLKKLNVNQQNQVKNQMLLMKKFVDNKKMNLNDFHNVFKNFTNVKNIQNINNKIKKYQKSINVKTNSPTYNLQSNELFVNNVTLGNLINKLNIGAAVLAGISAAAAIFSAVEFSLAWFFGLSIPWAIGSASLALVTGCAASSMTIASQYLNNESNNFSDGLETDTNYFFGSIGIMAPIIGLGSAIATCVAGITATSWAFPASLAALGVVGFFITLLSSLGVPV